MSEIKQNEIKLATEQFGKTKTAMMFFIGTSTRVVAMKADPKAAERAKRYIWSRIPTAERDWK